MLLLLSLVPFLTLLLHQHPSFSLSILSFFILSLSFSLSLSHTLHHLLLTTFSSTPPHLSIFLILLLLLSQPYHSNIYLVTFILSNANQSNTTIIIKSKETKPTIIHIIL